MAGRYEIVEEPEALEVVDDDDGVYHPDQSIRDMGQSIRSLEPIVSGPIGLKTVFYDPRWSPNQRKCCVVVMGAVVLACLSILISLFAGLGKVLNHIAEREAMKSTGLYMVPDLEELGSATFYYQFNNRTNDPRGSFRPEYIALINATYQEYDPEKQKGSSWHDCKTGGASMEGHYCKYNWKQWENTPCNLKTNDSFGFHSNQPCLLFQFRKPGKWQPNLKNSKGLGVKCARTDSVGSALEIKVYPEDGFKKFLFPVYTGTDDEETSSPTPAVMIKFTNLQGHLRADESNYDVECRLDERSVKNLAEFHGTKRIVFQYRPMNPSAVFE